MAINLRELRSAAVRYDAHQMAMESAKQNNPEEVIQEQAADAKRHRELFVPAAERLQAVKSTVAAVMQKIETALDPTPPALAIPIIEEDPLLIIGDVIPEIAVRDNDLRPIRFLQLALLAARAVGRIQINDGPLTEEGDATGFLIAPGLLMTNYHVLGSEDIAAAASVIFDDEEDLNGELKETKIFRLRPDQLFVANKELDYAIVAVSSRTSSGALLSQFGYFRLFEMTGKLDPTQRQAANIVQHPGGGRKKIALRDNYVDEVVSKGADPAKKLNSLFYGTDTLKGSSGSPVCSDQWYVVALHRGGVPVTKNIDGKNVVMRIDGTPAHKGDSQDRIHYLTNEGTRTSRIISSLSDEAAGNAHAASALQKIRAAARDPRTGPISTMTAPIMLPTRASAEEGGIDEIIRRSRRSFEGLTGYRPDFLGAEFQIPLPTMTSEVERELATLKDSAETELKYDNYSIYMSRERRTAFFAAGNIDGGQLWKAHGVGALPNRPPWSIDPRMDETFQPDDTIFSNAFQRGHLFKREDAVWGEDKEAMKQADLHSFTITNATPMIANFNNVEWGDLEDIVTKECDAGNRVSYFAGPIFRTTDPYYNELRANAPASELRRGMRVPQSFWKIVTWVEQGNLKAAGFILFQTNEIDDYGPITEEINFGGYNKIPITEIEQATGLRFPQLVGLDS